MYYIVIYIYFVGCYLSNSVNIWTFIFIHHCDNFNFSFLFLMQFIIIRSILYAYHKMQDLTFIYLEGKCIWGMLS
jgi:hypothetical protein